LRPCSGELPSDADLNTCQTALLPAVKNVPILGRSFWAVQRKATKRVTKTVIKMVTKEVQQ
jgi:hypothetical protein